MKNWSDSPFAQTVPLGEVDSFRDTGVIARDNGESSIIYELPDHPGWLVKLYRPEVRIDQGTLTRLIGLPAGMPSGDLGIVDRSTAWPVARVVSGYRTVGTIMAKAPQEFFWDIELLGGRTKRKIIDVDLLANSEERMRKLGLPVPSGDARFASLREIVAVAELFERYGVVYGDWSFANAFWSPKTQRILVIDMDTSGIGTGPLVQSPNWEDPLALPGQPLTAHADRYKVALLVARAVTGERTGRMEAVEAMERLHPGHRALTDLLRRCVAATSAERRPSLTDLLKAMDSHGGEAQTGDANVTGMRAWKPGGRPRATQRRFPPPPPPLQPQRSAAPRQTPRAVTNPPRSRPASVDPPVVMPTRPIPSSAPKAKPVPPRPTVHSATKTPSTTSANRDAFIGCMILGGALVVIVVIIFATLISHFA